MNVGEGGRGATMTGKGERSGWEEEAWRRTAYGGDGDLGRACIRLADNAHARSGHARPHLCRAGGVDAADLAVEHRAALAWFLERRTEGKGGDDETGKWQHTPKRGNIGRAASRQMDKLG